MVVGRVGGGRLLICVVGWPVLAAALIGATVVGLRLSVREWARAHSADLGAIALLEAYLALLAVLLVTFGGRHGLAGRLGFQLPDHRQLLWAVVGWAFTFSVGGGLTVAFALLTRQQPKSNAVDVLKISLDPLFVALVVPTVALLAPAGEELLFRGALFGWLRGHAPLAAAVVVSAAVFAGAHLILPLFPYFFVFGVTTALIYQRTGSTVVTFVMHAGQNTLAVVAAYVTIAGGRTG